MKVAFSYKFIKLYNKRIKYNKKLAYRFDERFDLFRKDPYNKLLRLHRLKGDRRSLYAFSITGDVRVILSFDKDIAIFQDIGTHNQVY